MFYLLTILTFLLALRLEEASASPITVMGVARSTFVVRGTTVEKIRGPFAIGGGGGLLHNFKEERKDNAIGACNTDCKTALPEREPGCVSALWPVCLHAHSTASRECCG